MDNLKYHYICRLFQPKWEPGEILQEDALKFMTFYQEDLNVKEALERCLKNVPLKCKQVINNQWTEKLGKYSHYIFELLMPYFLLLHEEL